MPNTTGAVPSQLQKVLEGPHRLRETAPGIWSLADTDLETAHYDSIGRAYDSLGGMKAYHRIFWGVSTKLYRDFAVRAGQARAGGTLLDAGCGSMLFSAEAHLRSTASTIIGADISRGMLQLARKRLGEAAQGDRTFLLHANILRSPFCAASFDVALCLHVAHVVEDLAGLLCELRRVIKPGGWLFLTSVVLAGGWRDHYLRTLNRRGIMATPRTAREVLDAHQLTSAVESESDLRGSMLLVRSHVSG